MLYVFHHIYMVLYISKCIQYYISFAANIFNMQDRRNISFRTP